MHTASSATDDALLLVLTTEQKFIQTFTQHKSQAGSFAS